MRRTILVQSYSCNFKSDSHLLAFFLETRLQAIHTDKNFPFFQNIALVGSLQLVTSYKHCTQRKNREAWFNYVKSQNPTGMSLSIENVPPKVDTPVDFHLEVYHSQPMGVQYVSI